MRHGFGVCTVEATCYSKGGRSRTLALIGRQGRKADDGPTDVHLANEKW